MISIFINEQEIDLAVDTKVVLSKKFEDLQNPDKRTAAHSYTITAPRSKTNELIFGSISSIYVEDKFKNNSFDAYILGDNITVLSGTAKITKLTRDSYSLLIYDGAVNFFDSIKDKNLQDLEFGNIAIFSNQYEYSGQMLYNRPNVYIRIHNNADLNSDATPYQFPFIYYNNFHLEDSTELTSGPGHDLMYGDNKLLNEVSIDLAEVHYKYMVGTTYGSSAHNNYQYYEHFPPAVYVISVLNKIFEESGWSLVSSITQGITELSKQFKKLILPFVGDTSIWEEGNGITNVPDDQDPDTGSYYLYYKLEKWLPDMNQSDFLKQLVLLFNLYFVYDSKTKTVYMETYDNFFLDKTYSYDLNNMLNDSNFTITPISESDRNVNLYYATDDGDGANTNSDFISSLRFINNETGDESKDVELKFAPTYFREIGVINNKYFDDEYTADNANVISHIALPYISSSSPSDDQGILWWNKDNTDVYPGAGAGAFDPSVMNYGMSPRILKYEGLVNMTDTGDDDLDKERHKYFVYIKDRFSNISVGLKMNQCSFFSINIGEYPNEIKYNELIHDFVYNSTLNRDGSKLNLCFGDYPYYALTTEQALYPNRIGLYSLNYLSKYANALSSNNLEIKCTISSEDYINLKANIPILVDDIYYTLLNIKNYNVNTGYVTIQLKRDSKDSVSSVYIEESAELPGIIPSISVEHILVTETGFTSSFDITFTASEATTEDYEILYLETETLTNTSTEHTILMLEGDTTVTISESYLREQPLGDPDCRNGRDYEVTFTIIQDLVEEAYVIGSPSTTSCEVDGISSHC